MTESIDNIESCIVCGGSIWKSVFSKLNKIKLASGEQEFDQKIICCEKCGNSRVIFNRDYTDEKLSNYYKNVPRTPVSLEKIYENKEDPRVKNAINRVNFIKDHTKGKRLLEIGFGDGFTLLESVKQGFDCSGVDVTGDYDENILLLKDKGVQIHNEVFNQYKTEDKYDIVTAFLLLEHIKDPESFMEQIKGYLTEDGYIVLEVPDVKNYQRFYSETQLTFEHTYHYTIAVLESLMNKYGFELVCYQSPGVSYDFAMTCAFQRTSEPKPQHNIAGNGGVVIDYFNKYFDQMKRYGYLLREEFDAIVSCHDDLVVFGAGNFFETIVDFLGQECTEKVAYFVDETKSKNGKKFYGKIIQDLEYFAKDKPEAVLVASEMFGKQIKKKLIDLHPECNVFCIQDEINIKLKN
ncbi:class I SAM-dependent methyltransferase [Parvicella tangerina]|uniref:Class I SAM-dependent methyltransferase n=1 Tax=Parvicella tangerina TaxID=2829795 RepID=A0A916JL89_9FLAO|nr:class I SAM-dependent methyltransferase [Parvicella tangerina]CAG5079708.1 hypothetical protein CRYO30217_01027 [Parvicella tangerina]